jgi:hypothetical protein
LSKVAVQTRRSYVPAGYGSNGMSNLDFVDYATVTAVTVEGTTYPLKADTVPLLKGSTGEEVTFVLSEPVAVLR